MQITPHIPQHTVNSRGNIDGRTTRHPGYAVSRPSMSVARGVAQPQPFGPRLMKPSWKLQLG